MSDFVVGKDDLKELLETKPEGMSDGTLQHVGNKIESLIEQLTDPYQQIVKERLRRGQWQDVQKEAAERHARIYARNK